MLPSYIARKHRQDRNSKNDASALSLFLRFPSLHTTKCATSEYIMSFERILSSFFVRDATHVPLLAVSARTKEAYHVGTVFYLAILLGGCVNRFLEIKY